MSRMDKQFGKGKIGWLPGRALELEEPETQWLTFADFSGGHNSSASREQIPANQSPRMLDMEIDRKNRLRRVPGTTVAYDLTDHETVDQMALHAALDNRSELVLFDPPYLGVISNEGPIWSDHALPGISRYNWTNFGGTLIFSNGRLNAYARQFGSPDIEILDEAPPAGAYASFAGRVFAGDAIIEGNREPIGVRWSAANSDYRDWSNLGSGFELLINDMSSGDRIMALRTMNLDFMAVVMRNSIWIARRTGITSRPADFQPRVPGVGTVSGETVQLTSRGLLFLSDTGVYLFDGNQATMISEQINSEIVPLDLEDVASYGSAYHPREKLYYLYTPVGTYVYDVEKNRWMPRSMIARGGTIFAPQFDQLTWAEFGALTWADRQQDLWSQVTPQQGPTVDMLHLGNVIGIRSISREDRESITAMGLQIIPSWDSPILQQVQLNRLRTVKQINYEYEGIGTLSFSLLDLDSQMLIAVDDSAILSVFPTLVAIPMLFTGKGVAIRVEIQSGDPVISKMQLGFIDRGVRIDFPGIAPREYYNDF